MKNKKLALLTAIFLVTATAATVAGCEMPTLKPKPTPTTSYEVSFENETVLMMVGEESALIAEYTMQEGLGLTFSSSDESIVKVDEYGRITALKEGTATITVYYGTASDTCVVTVTMNGLLPLLQMPGIPSNEVTMNKSSSLDLRGEVFFNGNVFDDVTLTYELSDESVGKIENGVFTPLASGTTEIYVTGTWRGSSADSLTKTITVNVVPEFLLVVNDGDSEISLQTQSNTVSPFVVTAELEGESLATSVEITSGSQYVKYDSDKNTVVSLGVAGQAEITITCEVNGETKQKVIPVYVTQTLYKYEKVVTNFSAIHGDVAIGKTLRTILGGNITSAYDQNGNALEVKDNKVYGVESSKNGKFTSTITIYNETHGYELNIEGYSGVFSKAEDLAVFNTNVRYGSVEGSDSKAFTPIDASKPMQKWDGYYVLANNIDASEYTHASNGEALNTRGIQSGYTYGLNGGTFDGQGYTIKGITMQEFGLFGYVINSTIKNVAFVDVTFDSSVEYATTLATWIHKSVVSNVYISVANEDTYGARMSCFAGGVNESSIVGCIVETKESLTFKSGLKAIGSFTYMNKERMDGDEVQTVFQGVYVISKETLGYYQSSNAYLQAENETLVLGDNEKAYTLEGVKKYATIADMQADTANRYTEFDKTFWTIENGMPVWKSVNGEYPSADDLIIDEVSEKETVKDFDVDWLK